MVQLANSALGEKTEAGFCFGLAYNDDYICTFDAVYNVTFCDGINTAYIVEWAGAEYGLVYDLADDSYMGEIVQSSSGAYQMYFADGDAVGECLVLGDVVTLCIEPA